MYPGPFRYPLYERPPQNACSPLLIGRRKGCFWAFSPFPMQGSEFPITTQRRWLLRRPQACG